MSERPISYPARYPQDIRPSCRGAALIRRQRRWRRAVHTIAWATWACAMAVFILLAGGGW